MPLDQNIDPSIYTLDGYLEGLSELGGKIEDARCLGFLNENDIRKWLALQGINYKFQPRSNLSAPDFRIDNTSDARALFGEPEFTGDYFFVDTKSSRVYDHTSTLMFSKIVNIRPYIRRLIIRSTASATRVGMEKDHNALYYVNMDDVKLTCRKPNGQKVMVDVKLRDRSTIYLSIPKDKNKHACLSFSPETLIGEYKYYNKKYTVTNYTKLRLTVRKIGEI